MQKEKKDHRKGEFQKNIYFCFIDCAKAFDCADYNKLWKILKEMGIPDHLTCLLWNLYAVKKQQLEPDIKQWTGSKFGKEYIRVVYCYPAYLTYAEYIMQNSRLDESQAGIKIGERNINNFRYTDDTTFMAESWLIWKDPDAGKDWEQGEKGTIEEEMVGWHYRLNGLGFG